MWPEAIQCLSCRIGTLRRGKATDAMWLGGQLVLVPNVAAWQCDVCGDFAYDDETLTRVELLLGSQIERPGPHRAHLARSGPSSRSAADDTKRGEVK